MGKLDKTNAIRHLETLQIAYETHRYDTSDGGIDGVTVAGKVGIEPERVFKTLVTRGASGSYHIFVIPVAHELDLKKAARAAGEKNVAMIPVADINKVTGYIRGGCSPIGMKKPYPVHLDETAILYDRIVVSAGRIGLQMELTPDDLCRAAEADYADLTASCAK